jgi:UrcA family protein
MSIHDSIDKLAVSRVSASLLVVLCGAFGAAAAGAAGAATVGDDAPRIVVRYSVDSLATDSGARKLYARLVHAAEQACPDDFSSGRLSSPAVQTCRRQSIARAVHQIDSPRLAAVYATSSKSG